MRQIPYPDSASRRHGVVKTARRACVSINSILRTEEDYLGGPVPQSQARLPSDVDWGNTPLWEPDSRFGSKGLGCG